PDLLQELPDHAADAHGLGPLLVQICNRALFLAVVALTDLVIVRAHHHDVRRVVVLIHKSHRTSRIFPTWLPESNIRCASAASDIGTSAYTTGRTAPSSISGHTLSTTLRTMAPFSSTGRARSVVACTEARLASSAPRSSSALRPPCSPMITSRPPVLSARTFRSRYLAPMMSRITSALTFSAKSSSR